MSADLSRFQQWIIARQRRLGTPQLVVIVTLISILISASVSYGVMTWAYGFEGVFDRFQPMVLLLPIAVPAIVAPIVSHQLSSTLTLTARLLDELSKARLSLENEVVARERVQVELEYLVRSDELTGLLNRRGFFAAIAALSPDETRTLVLATVDVDRFKTVNDTYGHAVGDQVLRAVGQRLRDAAGNDAVVARIGGDEFVAALVGSGDNDGIASDIRAALAAVDVEDPGIDKFVIECSVGVAAHSVDVGIDTTLAHADFALYEQKADYQHRSRSGAATVGG